MAQHLVFNCDWCGDEVPAKADNADEGRFTAQVTIELPKAFSQNSASNAEICGQCKNALDALSQGKYRRGGA